MLGSVGTLMTEVHLKLAQVITTTGELHLEKSHGGFVTTRMDRVCINPELCDFGSMFNAQASVQAEAFHHVQIVWDPCCQCIFPCGRSMEATACLAATSISFARTASDAPPKSMRPRTTPPKSMRLKALPQKPQLHTPRAHELALHQRFLQDSQ